MKRSFALLVAALLCGPDSMHGLKDGRAHVGDMAKLLKAAGAKE